MSKDTKGDCGGKLIAVVDDDMPFLRSVGRLLLSSGFTVASFSSAVEYLAAAAQLAPGCLLLDVQMPQMTGLELLERLNALNYRVPIILITAHDSTQAREQVQSGNCARLLLKPFDKQALLDAIYQVLADPPNSPSKLGAEFTRR